MLSSTVGVREYGCQHIVSVRSVTCADVQLYVNGRCVVCRHVTCSVILDVLCDM